MRSSQSWRPSLMSCLPYGSCPSRGRLGLPPRRCRHQRVSSSSLMTARFQLNRAQRLRHRPQARRLRSLLRPLGRFFRLWHRGATVSNSRSARRATTSCVVSRRCSGARFQAETRARSSNGSSMCFWTRSSATSSASAPHPRMPGPDHQGSLVHVVRAALSKTVSVPERIEGERHAATSPTPSSARYGFATAGSARSWPIQDTAAASAASSSCTTSILMPWKAPPRPGTSRCDAGVTTNTRRNWSSGHGQPHHGQRHDPSGGHGSNRSGSALPPMTYARPRARGGGSTSAR